MKSIAQKFQGLLSFIVTPTANDGDTLDLAALERFIDSQIESGVDSIVVFGSTGGIGSFSETKRQQVIKAAVRHVDGRASNRCRQVHCAAYADRLRIAHRVSRSSRCGCLEAYYSMPFGAAHDAARIL